MEWKRDSKMETDPFGANPPNRRTSARSGTRGALRMLAVLAVGLAALGLAHESLGANVLRNAGAEEGPCVAQSTTTSVPGWVKHQVLQASVGCYGASFMPDACPALGGCGTNVFYGGPDVCGLCSSELRQTLAITPSCAGAVDAGTVAVELSAYLGARNSAANDDVRVLAEFVDSLGNVLGTLQVGPVSGTDRQMNFVQQSGTIAPGTRHVRVRILFRNNLGTVGPAQSYADQVSLNMETTCAVALQPTRWARVKALYR